MVTLQLSRPSWAGRNTNEPYTIAVVDPFPTTCAAASTVSMDDQLRTNVS
jgi:hypothetical protein